MRTLIAAFAYVLSSFGIFSSLGATVLSVAMIAEPSMFDSPQSYLLFGGGFVVLYAWISHVVMCANWIAGKRSNKAWPISGTIAAGFSIYCFATVLSSTGGAYQTQNNFILALLTPIIFTLPAFLLAIYLVWFHMFSVGEQNHNVG